LVIEADEFDRSFHQFSADMAVLLNIEADHLDYYAGGIDEIERSFRRFLRNLPHRTGTVVAYGKNASIRRVCKGFNYKFRWYSEENLWPGLKLPMPGTHYQLNATAAARIAHELGIDQETIKKALATFPGVGRRFEHLGRWKEVEVYDDYAHHPTELAATLQGFREKFPQERLVVVFQPHQKSRTLNLLKEFGRCFDKHSPDELILAPIFEVPGREEPLEIRSSDIATQISEKPVAEMEVHAPESNEDLEKMVAAAAEKEGILVTVGAGSIRSFIERWMQ
jgi:UDP-N-acetylmuramate--alanine ligase